eukprot:8977335-Pyramimonas_sp.AAC.1
MGGTEIRNNLTSANSPAPSMSRWANGSLPCTTSLIPSGSASCNTTIAHPAELTPPHPPSNSEPSKKASRAHRMPPPACICHVSQSSPGALHESGTGGDGHSPRSSRHFTCGHGSLASNI